MEAKSGPQQAYSATKSRLLDVGVTDYEVNEDPTWHATMTIPGLTFESCDRDKLPRMQSLMLFGTLCRGYAQHIPYDEFGSVFIDWPKLTEDLYVFMSAIEISVSREMYDRAISKKVLLGKCMLGHVSNSAVTHLIWLSTPASSKPIYEEINSLVMVSKVTRKPVPLPSWFKDRYQGRGAVDKSLRVIPLERPSDTFIYKFKVAWSDTDINNHTNFSSYVRFAVDALHAALLDEQKRSEKGVSSGDGSGEVLKGLTKDIVKNGLKNVKIVYLKECLEGQEVDAHVWQEPGNPCLVKCAMESCRADLCHVTLEYFDSL